MNIFVLSKDPKEAAQLHCDKHVVKMILETGQMLCAAHWIGWQRELKSVPEKGKQGLIEWAEENIPTGKIPPWKMTHVGHPCTQWAQRSAENYEWLLQLGLSLCSEYTVRYGKHHKAETVYEWLSENRPPKFEGLGFTQFAIAMPDDCKVSEDPVECYRQYYRVHKRYMAKWKTREPDWFSPSSCDASDAV
jgi:hypothetical protein